MREPNSEEEDGGDDCRVPVLQSLEGGEKKEERKGGRGDKYV